MHYLWTNSLALGLPEIDKEHRDLFAGTNRLLAAMCEGQDAKIVLPLAERLGEQVLQHFDSEERAMAAVGYPGLATQRVEHAEFAADYLHLLAALKHGPSSPYNLVAVQKQVGDWLCDHIYGSDLQFGAYANSRGYRAAA